MYGRAIAATLFLFLAGFLTVTTCECAGATPLDSAIAVAGNRHIDAAMIRSHFHAGAAGRLDAGALDTALKSLYATGLFQDVKISQAGERVLVTVVENPTIARLVFEGNEKIEGRRPQEGAAIERRRAAVARHVLIGKTQDPHMIVTRSVDPRFTSSITSSGV